MISNTNAARGTETENLFKNSITKQKECLKVIKEALSINSVRDVSKAYKTGGDGGKADVIINVGGGEMIGANIKSYAHSKAGFNQAMRMHPKNLIEKFNIPQDIGKIIIDSILRKALRKKQGYSKEPFISPQDSDAIIGFFKNKALNIVRYSICGDENPELLVLFNQKEGKMQIYLMRDVLEVMNNIMDVKITDKGVIRLNKFFSIQKKGGNGGHEKYEKTELNHGGNNIQVKINTASFGEEVKPLCSYSTKPKP